MKILIIGNADSVWIKEYCACVLMKRDCQVTISSHYNDLFADFYHDNKIEVIKQSWRDDCGFVERLFYFIKEVRSLRQSRYDFVHVHFCSRYSLRLANFLRGKKIATFYGSDLFRITPKKRREISFYLEGFDKIILLNEKMLDVFKSNDKLKSLVKKASVFDFGITNLYYIKKAMNNTNKEKCKKRFHMPENKTIIAVGYNKSEAHQHNKVLESLRDLPQNIKNNVCLLFHMSYGNCSDRYWNEFLRLVDEVGCEYVVITDFLIEEEIAYLRMSVDIYINAQTTDALSASLMEYIFVGSIVINGSWLNYKELDELGIKYESFDDFTDILSIIINYFNKNISKIDTDGNRKIVWNNYSWDARIDDWLNIYEFSK